MTSVSLFVGLLALFSFLLILSQVPIGPNSNAILTFIGLFLLTGSLLALISIFVSHMINMLGV